MIRTVLALFALVLTIPAAAADIVYAKRLPPATLLELAARPETATGPREVRNESRQHAVGVFTASRPQLQPAGDAADFAPPPILGGFSATSSSRIVPADAGGAVGPAHVVGAFNSGIVVQTRDGKLLGQLSLKQFWDDSSRDFIYDPRIAYDAVFDRWVTIAIQEEHSMLIAVSSTGDPTGGWTRYSLRLNTTGGGIDFSRLALTRDTIVAVTERVSYASCVIISTQKADLYRGGATVPVRVDDTHGSSAQVVPVTSNDSEVEYILHSLDVGSIGIKRVDEAQWQNIESRYTWEPAEHMAKQRDSGNELYFGFDEIHGAVMRNGVIYAVQMIGIPGARGRSALLWWKIDAAARKVIDQGVIDDGTTWYGFPSIAVARGGGALIGYTATSPVEYPSSRYVFIDPNGKRSSEAPIKSGTWSIRSTDRWGDYSSTVIDPTDDSTFWTLQLFALDDRWEAWWAKVKAPAVTNRRPAVRH